MLKYAPLLKLKDLFERNLTYYKNDETQKLIFDNPKIENTAFYRRRIYLGKPSELKLLRKNDWNVHQL